MGIDQFIKPRLREVLKIKIGGKGEKRVSRYGKEYYQPVKYDHFVITKTERDDESRLIVDDEIMGRLGEHCTELDVMLLFDEIKLNFPYWFAYYEGKICVCSGDGEKARRRIVEKGEVVDTKEFDCNPDTCEYFKKNQCKPHGVLSVILKQMSSIGGVAVFRTGSWNSIQEILGSLEMIKFTAGGRLAGIPLKLKVAPKKAEVKGRPMLIYTVYLEYKGLGNGKSITEELMDRAIELSKKRQLVQTPVLIAERRKEIEHIEVVEKEHIADEFYPENQRQVAEHPNRVEATEIIKRNVERDKIEKPIIDKPVEVKVIENKEVKEGKKESGGNFIEELEKEKKDKQKEPNEFKVRINEAIRLKQKVGETKYYKTLKEFGFEHCNQFRNFTDFDDFLAKLLTTNKDTQEIKYQCGCGASIPKVVYDYSMQHFSEPLCRTCQNKERERRKPE